MNRHLALFILKLFGWRIVGTLPQTVKKVIVVMAPHTSNWDFFMGWLGYSALGLKSKYLIKKEAFFFPLGFLIKKVGGIPVNRGRNSVVHQVSELFKKSEGLILTVTPEGTRALNFHWKRGFYNIAQQADVPLVLGFLDYKEKIGGLGPLIYITGDYEKDMKVIENFYKDKTARFPQNFNLSPENLKKRRSQHIFIS
jgi:1-acyl-sn-glycerol-3-phosphate acyltransferase